MAGSEANSAPKILLISEDPAELDVLQGWLHARDYQVDCAQTSAQVKKQLTVGEAGIVFCSLTMTGPDGLEILRQIKQTTPAVQVVMLSEQEDFHIVRQVMRENALDFLLRPVAEERLLVAAERGVSAYLSEMRREQVYEEAQRRMSDLVLLRQIGETTNRENVLQELLERIIDSITVSVGVESASLMLSEGDGTLKIAAARGLSEEVINSVHISSGQGVSGYVLKTGEPLLIRDLEIESHFHGLVGGERYKTKSLLTVPILLRDRILGVINVSNKLTGQLFGIEDQNLLVTIAHQVALAIENFTLVNSLRQQADTLERINKDLVKFNRARTRMVSNLSHELKTPLTSMMGFVDLALTFFHRLSESELKDYLHQVREEGGNLERLISGMLRLFSIESDRERWQWKAFALDLPLHSALETQTREIAQRHLQVEITVPDDLPELYGDVEKFSMALQALLDNAVKFNREGGRLTVQATVERCQQGPCICLRIANDGASIPADARETIFDQYTQLGDLNTDKPCGVGVGLALVKAVVDRMRGRVGLDEHDEDRTIFKLLLPTVETYHVFDAGESAPMPSPAHVVIEGEKQ